MSSQLMFSELFLMSNDRQTMWVTHKPQVCLFSVSTGTIKKYFLMFFPCYCMSTTLAKYKKICCSTILKKKMHSTNLLLIIEYRTQYTCRSNFINMEVKVKWIFISKYWPVQATGLVRPGVHVPCVGCLEYF